jgi:hypothetical protein
MNAARRALRAGLSCLIVCVAFARPAVAQLISLKTVPVAAGDQFLIYPSENLGMGGVAIALDDPLFDPFVNPAKGSRVGPSQFFALPTYYSISGNAGSGRTVSAGSFFGAQRVFGGAVVSLQQLKRGEQFFGPVPMLELVQVVPPNALSRQSATNKYAFLTLGTKLAGDVAVAASASLSDLGAMDGVEHLYALAADIEQAGHTEDFRVGVTKQLRGGRTLEALALHSRFKMTHDVTYVDWVLVDSTTGQWEQQARLETNVDRTNTWGLHLGYVQPVGTAGWRVGGVLTGNRKSHPQIPNYELVNIPRDPGHSTAFDIGVGIANVTGPTTFGMDVIYEPARSSTWANAAAPVPTASGDTIPMGGRTVENEFRFSNALVNMGVAREVGPAAFQLGLQIRAYDYHLDQWDNVT